jgi:hypothetical protein
MFHLSTKRIAVALFASGLALVGPTLNSASAQQHRSGGAHYRSGGHAYYRGGGHRWHGGGYYGGGYYGPGYYGPGPGYYYGPAPGCVPLLGLVSGDFCN